MARWAPDARGRLSRAAMELYGERGFDRTTAAEIAARAGLTERTFFRHFADKREVLFGGASALQDALVRRVGEAPESAGPMDAVVSALATAEDVFVSRDQARLRQLIIAAHPDLRERELIKLATLSAALAGELRRRGVADRAADLAADAAMAVFRTAFSRWIDETDDHSFHVLVHQSLAELRAVTAAG